LKERGVENLRHITYSIKNLKIYTYKRKIKMNESTDLIMKTLIGYRQQIQELTEKYPDQDVSIEIEKKSKQIDNFITNYRQLDRAQRRFDKYLQGVSFSYSPELRGGVGLTSFSESNSFKDWTELVSGCVGDTEVKK